MSQKNVRRVRTQISETFRKARESRNLTQREISERLNLRSSQFVSNIERGLCKIPPQQYRTLSEILGKDNTKQLADLAVAEYRIKLYESLK